MKKILVNSHSIGLDIGVLFCSWVNFVHSGPFTFDFTLQQQQFLSRLISSPLTPFVYIYLNIYICLYTYIFLCPQIVQSWARSYQQHRPLLASDVNAWQWLMVIRSKAGLWAGDLLLPLSVSTLDFFSLGTTIYHGTLKYFSHRLRCSCSVCKHLIREFLRTILRA